MTTPHSEGEPLQEPTYLQVFNLCVAALADDTRVTIDEDLARRCAEVILDELVDSAVLFTAERFDEDCHACELLVRDHRVDGRHPPAPPAWGDWTEPASDVVDELTRWGTFAADRIGIALMGDLSVTEHERTRREVRAAVRLLLANGLIQATIPTDEVMIHMDGPLE